MTDAAAPRVLGLDEGPFRFDDATVPVVGVLCRGAAVVEAIVVGAASVDGFDATACVTDLVARLPGAGPTAVFVDGITLGGMNLVDLEAASSGCGRPVYGITRRAPDRTRMLHALQQAPAPARRRPMLPSAAPLRLDTPRGALHVQRPAAYATDAADARLQALVMQTLLEGALPEPLRLAHHMATALVRGVSGTRA